MAAETGGAEFAAPAGDYAAVLGRIQRDLRSQYILGFHPEAGGDSKHLLRVAEALPHDAQMARPRSGSNPDLSNLSDSAGMAESPR